MIPLDKDKTDVIIRRFRSGRKELIAVFPGLLGCCNDPSTVTTFMEIGGHCGNDYFGVVNGTQLVRGKGKEVKELISILKGYGYNLRVVSRMTRIHRKSLQEQASQ